MIQHHHYQEDNFLLTVFYGTTTPEEIHKVVNDLQKIDQEEGGMRGLTIFCANVKSKGIKARDIMSAGEKMKHVNFRKNGKNVIIAKTLLTYGLSRMYQVATEILNLDELKVYKENGFDDAIEWLGLEYLKDRVINIINECEGKNINS